MSLSPSEQAVSNEFDLTLTRTICCTIVVLTIIVCATIRACTGVPSVYIHSDNSVVSHVPTP